MKVNVESIVGYSDMTAEEKVKALEAFEFQSNEAELKKALEENKNLKTLISKANSEAADWKKQYRETLSEADRSKAEQEEKLNSLIAENNELKTKSKVDEYSKEYIARGYSPELAGDTAKALVDGDMDKVFANEKQFTEALKKELLAGKVSEQTNLSGGQPPTPEDAEKAEIAKILSAAGIKGE